jgi:uncharacterized RDD family membrane protein YckC
MDTTKCEKCGQGAERWAEFCPHCGEPMASYARPAGFWIRVGAHIIDMLVFVPIVVLSFWNTLSLKSMVVLVASVVPTFLYKPCMESFFGATLGKMACRIKVINAQGKKLGLFYAYARAFPFLVAAGVNLARQLVLFSSPQTITSFIELSQTRTETYWDAVNPLIKLLLMVDCTVIGFTPRKRALHALLAASYCVYKEP